MLLALNNAKCCRIFSFFFLLFYLFSCKTTPIILEIESTKTLPLDSGASVYITGDAKRSQSLLGIFPLVELENKQVRQMIDRTDTFSAALFPQESGRHFQLAARGKYPAFGAGFAFTFNRQWKKQRSASGDSYWYSQASGLSIMMNSKQAFVVSSVNNSPVEPAAASAGVEIPEGFSEFSADNNSAPISCWVENPAAVVSGIMEREGLPINFPVRQLFINFFPVEEFSGENRCEALVRLQFESSNHARAAAGILALAAGFASGSSPSIITSIFLANPPVQNGSALDIKTALLGEEEIKTFLIMIR